ncbi:zinc-binding dehydrogenase [Nonomuraea sp. NPDC050680]|uniref:quinone oxidoreductase family protein n=1 Tax=Nonomuraea sp. NPDC050680 TaxID=3154630 RepID=UPI0033F323F3
MRAIVVHELGGPEVLKAEDWPEPKAGEGQLVIRTRAIGVSYAETQLRAGTMPFPMPVPLPAVFGAEVAGVVTEVGAGVDEALLGTTVAAVTGGVGSYAEYAAVQASLSCPVPDGVSPVDAVAAAAPGAIALALLHRAGLKGGETVLVEAGASSVGTYLLRHAKEFGAERVIATAGAAPKRERARQMGADEVVDHRAPDWPGQLPDVNVVFDSIGGPSARQVLDHLTPGSGRMLCYGSLSGEPAAVGAADLWARGVTIIGCGGPAWGAKVFGVHYPEMLARVADGRSHAYVDTTLPLESAAEAHRRLEGRTALGRVILTP